MLKSVLITACILPEGEIDAFNDSISEYLLTKMAQNSFVVDGCSEWEAEGTTEEKKLKKISVLQRAFNSSPSLFTNGMCIVYLERNALFFFPLNKKDELLSLMNSQVRIFDTKNIYPDLYTSYDTTSLSQFVEQKKPETKKEKKPRKPHKPHDKKRWTKATFGERGSSPGKPKFIVKGLIRGELIREFYRREKISFMVLSDWRIQRIYPEGYTGEKNRVRRSERNENPHDYFVRFFDEHKGRIIEVMPLD
jgi:hypothetical protein